MITGPADAKEEEWEECSQLHGGDGTCELLLETGGQKNL